MEVAWFAFGFKSYLEFLLGERLRRLLVKSVLAYMIDVNHRFNIQAFHACEMSRMNRLR